jgi:hypothetical protein
MMTAYDEIVMLKKVRSSLRAKRAAVCRMEADMKDEKIKTEIGAVIRAGDGCIANINKTIELLEGVLHGGIL